MKIVIDIDDNVYDLVKQFEKGLGLIDKQSDTVDTALMRAIINGIPLPEGYGRLGDLDALEASMRYEVLKHDLNEYGCLGLVSCAPTIIEATKEGEE